MKQLLKMNILLGINMKKDFPLVVIPQSACRKYPEYV